MAISREVLSIALALVLFACGLIATEYTLKGRIFMATATLILIAVAAIHL